MQSGCLVVVDGCRTVVFRRYVASRVCRSSHSLHWFKLVYHLSSAFSVVSMTVLLVLSTSSSTCLEFCEVSRLSFLRRFRSAVRRDLAHNLLDWSLSLLLVCFTSLVDNYLVVSLMISLRRYTRISPWSRVKEGDTR